jgi:hypothetical protein
MSNLINKATFLDTTPFSPALASHQGFLYIAWRGDGNEQLNMNVSSDGQNFTRGHVFGETSSQPPSIASTGDRLFIAWKGSGNDNLNIGEVALFLTMADDVVVNFGIEGLSKKQTVPDTSPNAPGLASFNGQLFITWRGDSNDNLNVAQVDISDSAGWVVF